MTIRKRRQVDGQLSEFWVSATGSNSRTCLQQPREDKPCRTLQYIVHNECLNNVTLTIYLLTDGSNDSPIPCDEDYTDYSWSDAHSCSLFLQGDPKHKTSIVCETQKRVQNISIVNKTFILSGTYENTQDIIGKSTLKSSILVTSFEARYLNFYNAILLLPNARTIFEDVNFYNSHVLHKSQYLDNCSISYKKCHFGTKPLNNHSLSSIDIDNCNTATVYFESVRLISTNFSISFLTSVEAELNDIA